MTRASFGTTTYITYQNPFWIWIWICVKFSFLCNFVNSAYTDMYDTSNESCAQGLYFFFLHLSALSNLWRHYDPKTEKKNMFLLITESFLHIKSCVMLLLKASSRPSFPFLTLTSLEQYMGTL